MEIKKTMAQTDKREAYTRFGLLLGIVILLNIISYFFFVRFDLTKEKRYSISAPTKKLVENLSDKIVVTVYLEDGLPAGFMRLRSATKDMLQELATYSNGKITYQFVNPLEGAKTEEEKKKIYNELLAQGLTPTNLQVKTEKDYTEKVIFPGMIVNAGGQYIPIPLLENQIGYSPEQALNNSVILLEYKIAAALKKLSNTKPAHIAFLTGHGELSGAAVEDFAQTLQNARYAVSIVNLSGVKTDSIPAQNSLENVDVLIIAKPQTTFSEKDKWSIDQFVMKGGKVLWLVESLAADMDRLRTEGAFVAQDMQLGLDDMLFKYGVRINKDVVQDAQLCNPIPVIDQNTGQPMLFPWYYFPLLTPSASHAIGKNLDPVASYFSSSIDTLKNPEIKKSVLLSTGQYSRRLEAPVRISLADVKLKQDETVFNKKDIICGVALEGKFTSLYKNRKAFVETEIAQNQTGTIEQGIQNKMIVLADGDILKNEIRKDGVVLPLGFNQYTQQTLQNKDFLLNSIEYLLDDNGLIETRNKEIKLRLLDKKKVQNEKGIWQIINTVLPLLLVFLFGVFYQYRRKRKYAR